MIAERLGLDVEIEVVAKPLPGLRTELVVVGLCRTEQTETHCQFPNAKTRAARPYIPSGPREIATTPVRDTSTSPSGTISVDELVDLVGFAGDLEDEALGRRIDHARPEGIGQAQRLDAVLARAAHLDQRQLALERLALGGEVDAPVDRHQPLELMA